MAHDGDARRAERRAVRAALAGHIVEWYEFGVYGVVAAYVAAAMFPSDDPVLSLLVSWTTYSIAFLVRPIGGIALAYVGDRFGRRLALFATVALMTIATVCLGIVPGYAAVGIAAPLAFVALRMVQGFAVGGEMPSATSYVVENVRESARARAASFLAAGTFGASLFGSAIAAALATLLGHDAMVSWGWRVLFLLALPLGLAAIAIRREAPDGAIQLTRREQARSPLREALRSQRGPIVRFIGIALAFNISLSIVFGGFLNELVLRGVPTGQAVVVNAATYAALAASILAFGGLAARIGRRHTLIIGLCGISIVMVPALFLITLGALVPAIIAGVIAAIPIGIYATPLYLSLAEMFPPRVRVTAGAVAFNSAAAIASVAPAVTLSMRSIFGFEHGLLVWGGLAVFAAVIALAGSRPRSMVDDA